MHNRGFSLVCLTDFEAGKACDKRGTNFCWFCWQRTTLGTLSTTRFFCTNQANNTLLVNETLSNHAYKEVKFESKSPSSYFLALSAKIKCSIYFQFTLRIELLYSIEDEYHSLRLQKHTLCWKLHFVDNVAFCIRKRTS